MPKFLLKMAGTNQAGKTIETSCDVLGEQKEIDAASWKITQSWIKEGVRNIHVVGVAKVVDIASHINN